MGGQAGQAIVGLLQKMGIADEVTKKSVYGKTGGEAVQKMAAGEADMAISFISEIKPIKGAKVAGALPAAVQNPSTYAGGIGVNGANPDIARALLKAMQDAAAKDLMAAEAAGAKARLLQPTSPEQDDPNIAAALAVASGTTPPPQTLSERLAALKARQV